MRTHTNTLEVMAVPATLVRVHGPEADVKALIAHIDTNEDVMLRRDPEPCNHDIGCWFIEAFVDGDTTADKVGNGWIASQN